MERRARVISAAVFAGLATIVVGASLTWACTGPDFGTPATPGNPPAPVPDASLPQAAPTTQAQGGAPAAAPVAIDVSPSTGSSGSGVTSGARGAVRSRAPARNQGSAGARAPVSVGVAPVRSRASTGSSTAVANSQFAQRSNGGTAGVTARGGQTVFASPAAKARATSKASRSRATPSAKSASGDLWAGVKPAGRSSVFAAEASAAKQGGGAPMTAALVVLGLGVVGLAGTASVLGLRRRRAEAKATGNSSSSGTAEM